MSRAFDYFVVFAAMRTGSNFLEASLNGYGDLCCHGELFNPHFIGHEGCRKHAGVPIEARDQDPLGFFETLRAETAGLSGFRFFNDHDLRVLKAALADPRAAKIILTRNPLDSYVSLKIARATGQWRLGGKAKAKTATIDFDADEFRAHLDAQGTFRKTLLRALPVNGQTGFHIAYDDLRNVDVLNGMARWLGSTEQKPAVSKKTRVQNPAPLSEKVRNFDQMTRALADMDQFGAFDIGLPEPRRGSHIPHYAGAETAPLLFMPLPGGPRDSIIDWLGRIDGAAPVRDFNQKTLRQWMRKHVPHQSFTVLRHPLARAHHMFATHILPVSDTTFLAIRDLLRDRHDMSVPDTTPGKDWSRKQHHDAFLMFLNFLKANLAGQTPARIDPGWSSQVGLIRGFAEFGPPDVLLREHQLQTGLVRLADDAGVDAKVCAPEPPAQPWTLDQIWSADLEQACRAAYARDYLIFGWQDWSAINPHPG
ncbi:MAG: nodulation protein NodH [Rhodobacteraceae bacterium]|nr:nodulation protein NodH [Paracoccaceae bacterium]